jgi:hypothetical protein
MVLRHQFLKASFLPLAIVVSSTAANAASVKDLPTLLSVTFYERTGGTEPTPYTFLKDGSELTTMLSDPLGVGNNDFGGASTEFYDVFYSKEDGSFDVAGEFLTISGVFLQTSPAGGGLNLAEISLNFSDASIEYGNYVASFEAYGDNAIPENVGRAIDGNLLTHTTMGNTTGTQSRLRLTLGFQSSSGPPPSVVPVPAGILLMMTGLGALGIYRRRKA